MGLPPLGLRVGGRCWFHLGETAARVYYTELLGATLMVSWSATVRQVRPIPGSQALPPVWEPGRISAKQ